MLSRRLSLILLFVFNVAATDAPEGSPAAGKPSGGIWQSVGRGLETANDRLGALARTASGAVVKAVGFSGAKKRTGLSLIVICDSSTVRIAQSRALTVKLQLFNAGKKIQLLEFASGQRAEVVLRDASGRIVSRASSSVGTGAGLMTLNSGERIEFLMQLPAGQLGLGKTYSLEAAMTGQAGLVTKQPVRLAS